VCPLYYSTGNCPVSSGEGRMNRKEMWRVLRHVSSCVFLAFVLSVFNIIFNAYIFVLISSLFAFVFTAGVNLDTHLNLLSGFGEESYSRVVLTYFCSGNRWTSLVFVIPLYR
jgi:hypothetical protein